MSRCFLILRKQTRDRFIQQDNDSCQNSRAARIAWECANVELVKIPPRSPDLNPVENVFKVVREEISTEAKEKQIQRETFAEFKERVRVNILGFPLLKINNLMASMDKRVKQIIERKGQRLRY